MRAPRRTFPARSALALTVGVAVSAGLSAGPVRAQEMQGGLPSVVVNPAFSDAATQGAGPWAYGAGGAGGQGQPPTVGMPLQLPPGVMPHSTLTLPPGMTPPAGAAVRAPVARPASVRASNPVRAVSSSPSSSTVDTRRMTDRSAPTRSAPGRPTVDRSGPETVPQIVRRPDGPAAPARPDAAVTAAPPSPAAMPPVDLGAPPPEPDVDTGAGPAPLESRGRTGAPEPVSTPPSQGEGRRSGSGSGAGAGDVQDVGTDAPAPAEPVSAPVEEPRIALAVPPAATLAATPKPAAPPRPVMAGHGASQPIRTRLAAGTTRLLAGRDGRIGPPPPPMTLQGAPMRQPLRRPAAAASAPSPAEAASAPPPANTSAANTAAAEPTPAEPTPAEPTSAGPAGARPALSAPEPPPSPDGDVAAARAPEGADQVAARPPSVGGGVAPGDMVSLSFENGAVALPDTVRPALDRVVATLTANAATKATVRAYADGDGDANQARRTSLSRALAVRAYLIDQGVESARIDVRALGDQYGSGPAERVDVVTSER